MAKAAGQDTRGRDTTPPTPSVYQTPTVSENEADQYPSSSHGMQIDSPSATADGTARPLAVTHMSRPAHQSPPSQHRRVPSRAGAVKETLNARSHYGSSDDDGASMHRINQYVVKQEIGRGSFGAVFLAVDQYGDEFAVKQFSKSRLRKRAQSNLLRQPNLRRKPGHLAAGRGFNSPLHRIMPSDRNNDQASRPFDLIKEEIAIMKKLHHNNVVNLIEVLDDPQEDTLYMVLEMCKKGIVMKVGLEDRAEPYSDEACRCWFRDMILGIEYLHAQGIIHRDIKPDNCLVTDDDVLKIVDFGVSEMFEKASDMSTAKSVGSPAFMPPELCVAKHGSVSGRAADVWSMGVTLYCLRYGHIPFEQDSMLELYDSIRTDEVPLSEETDESFRQLMRCLLEKDPEKRITMPELRKHPWVTKDGEDLLCSEEENCAVLVEPPTEAEMERAITGNMENLMVVMKAVRRFKTLISRKRPSLRESILGQSSRIVTPPQSMRRRQEGASHSTDAHDRIPIEQTLATEGIHRDTAVGDDMQKLPPSVGDLETRTPSADDLIKQNTSATNGPHDRPHASRSITEAEPHGHPFLPQSRANTFPIDDHAKGHAHDPLKDKLFLNIGVNGSPDEDSPDEHNPIVSESPSGIEDDIYELAYQDEMNRILDQRGKSAALFLNRRVDHREDLRSHFNVIADKSRQAAKSGVRQVNNMSSGGFGDLVRQAQSQVSAQSSGGFGDLVRQAQSHVSSVAGLMGGSQNSRSDVDAET